MIGSILDLHSFPTRRSSDLGLDVAGNQSRMNAACARLAAQGILVSLFIDADKKQIDAAVAANAPYIEIHTGQYAEAKNEMTIFRVDVLREVTAVLPQNVADKLRGRIQERLSGRYHHNKTMRL